VKLSLKTIPRKKKRVFFNSATKRSDAIKTGTKGKRHGGCNRSPTYISGR
jgi:hypothetical protein